MKTIQTILNKIDYRLSADSFSRPQYQVKLLVSKLFILLKKKTHLLVDIGGGQNPQYRPILSNLVEKYKNLEIIQGPHVDIVGSAYDIPLSKSSVDVVTLFMVMEHLNEPLEALMECHRVLKTNGLLALTTVQYWHTHNHPSDYYRYTRAGLQYLIEKSGFKLIDIWSIGGPLLVIYHSIELNLEGVWRTLFSIIFYRLFDWLDWLVFKHFDKRYYSDSVGWTLIAQKKR